MLGFGLEEGVALRPPSPLLGPMLRLFQGNVLPAIFAYTGFPRGWQPAPDTTLRTAVAAHLLGLALVGCYPFRGLVACSCDPEDHRCPGLGTRYLCIDIDAHQGEGDVDRLLASVVSVMVEVGMRPLTFTSRSATGAHVFAFFDQTISTVAASAAGRAVVAAAGAQGRCDVIPSAGHRRGLGTLHALPLSPRSTSSGGGILLDASYRPVLDPAYVKEALTRADRERSSAERVCRAASGIGVTPICVPRRRAPVSPRVVCAEADEAKLAAVRRRHPQYRRVVQSDPGTWRGGRSARDAAAAAILARQGVSPAGIKKALLALPGGKAGVRDEGYLENLARGVQPSAPVRIRFAGQRARRGEGSPKSPWRDRLPPPLDYDGERNPWWDVREQFRDPRRRGARNDAVVLAYLIDRWFRGPYPRRQFYMSMRQIAEALDIPPATINRVIKRIALSFPEILRVTRGLRGQKLRVATAFDVVCSRRSNDPLEWSPSSLTNAPRAVMLDPNGSNDRGRTRLGQQHPRDPEEHASPRTSPGAQGDPDALPAGRGGGRVVLRGGR